MYYHNILLLQLDDETSFGIGRGGYVMAAVPLRWSYISLGFPCMDGSDVGQSYLLSDGIFQQTIGRWISILR